MCSSMTHRIFLTCLTLLVSSIFTPVFGQYAGIEQAIIAAQASIQQAMQQAQSAAQAAAEQISANASAQNTISSGPQPTFTMDNPITWGGGQSGGLSENDVQKITIPSGTKSIEIIYLETKESSEVPPSTVLIANNKWGLKTNQYNRSNAYGVTAYNMADFYSNVTRITDKKVHLVVTYNREVGNMNVYVNGKLVNGYSLLDVSESGNSNDGLGGEYFLFSKGTAWNDAMWKNTTIHSLKAYDVLLDNLSGGASDPTSASFINDLYSTRVLAAQLAENRNKPQVVESKSGSTIFDIYTSPDDFFNSFGRTTNQQLDMLLNLDGGLSNIKTFKHVMLGNDNSSTPDGAIQLRELKYLTDGKVVGYVDQTNYFKRESDDEKLGAWQTYYGFCARNRGGLSLNNYDVIIDFNEKFIKLNATCIGADPWPVYPLNYILPVVSSGSNPLDNSWVSYAQNGQYTNWSSTQPGAPFNFITLASKAWTSLPIAKNMIKIHLDSFKHDEIQHLYGIAGGVKFPSASGVFPGKDISGSVEFATVPNFRLEEIGMGVDNLNVPLAMTGNTMYWQLLSGNVEGISTDPWQLNVNAIFTFGPTETKIPVIGYPIKMAGSIIVKENGYASAGLKTIVLGYDFGDETFTIDPPNSRVSFTIHDGYIAPIFTINGNASVTGSNFSADGSAGIKIPDSVPVIGGMGWDGISYHIAESNYVNWDVSAGISITITPAIPEVCVQVPQIFNSVEKWAHWDSCCWRTPWWLGKVCIGCPIIDWRNIVTTKMVDVCTPAIPAGKVSFRVGVKIDGSDVRPYFDKNGVYHLGDNDFFEQNYMRYYPEWETPFYNYSIDDSGRIAYYNYNWDLVAKDYFAEELGVFRPAAIQPNSQGSLEFSTHEGQRNPILARINYKGELSNPENVVLTLDGKGDFKGHSGNFPHGYQDSGILVASEHHRNRKELIFIVFEEVLGEHLISLNNEPNIGEYTLEVFSENQAPIIESIAANLSKEDGYHLNVQVSVADIDTHPDEIIVKIFLDEDLSGHNGHLIRECNLRELEQITNQPIDLSLSSIASGRYYLHVEVHDGRNHHQKKYFSQGLDIVLPKSLPPVEGLKVAPTIDGFFYNFEKIKNLHEFSDVSYTLMIKEEFVPHNSGLSLHLYGDELSGKVDNLVAGVPYLVAVIAIDGEGNKSSSRKWHRVVPGLDGYRPLYISSSSPRSANVGSRYYYQIDVQDGDILENRHLATDLHPKLAFKVVNGPEGLSVSELGLVEWTPTADQLGSHSIMISASRIHIGENGDQYEHNLVVNHEFRIEVLPLHHAASHHVDADMFISRPPHKVKFGEILEYQPAIIPTYPVSSFQLLAGPDGMLCDSSTGAIMYQADILNGEMVSIGAFDLDGQLIDEQSWFLDIQSPLNTLNDTTRVIGTKIESSQLGSRQLVVFWNAPAGRYNIECSSGLTEEWHVLNEEPLAGGYGVVSGFAIPQASDIEQPNQFFVRIVEP